MWRLVYVVLELEHRCEAVQYSYRMIGSQKDLIVGL